MVLCYLFIPHVQLQEHRVQYQFVRRHVHVCTRIVFSQHNSLSEIGANGFFFYQVLLCSVATNTCSFRCKFWLSDMFTHMGSNLEILGVPLVHCYWPSTCGDRVISVQLSQYHGCWCPGNVSPTFCELSNIIWRKYTMPARADPGFEVRGGANGSGKFEKREGC